MLSVRFFLFSEVTPVSALVMDFINKKYDQGTLKASTELMGRKWEMRKQRRSPRYTTCWQELPVVM